MALLVQVLYLGQVLLGLLSDLVLHLDQSAGHQLHNVKLGHFMLSRFIIRVRLGGMKEEGQVSEQYPSKILVPKSS